MSPIKMKLVFVFLMMPVLTVFARSTHFCPPTFVDCSCENAAESVITIALNTSLITDESTGMPRCVVNVDPLEICESRKCFIIPNDNFEALFKKGRIMPSLNSIDYDDYESDFEVGGIFSSLKLNKSTDYPVQFHYPRASRMTEGLLLRSKRQAGNWNRPCQVPELKNSEVICWKWPNYQTCRQTCIYGHGIQARSGTLSTKTFRCRNSENQWVPNNMVDCMPYANCRVMLKAPGDLSCTEPGNGPATCHITCEEYDDAMAERVTFVCNVDQRNIYLPHCAALDKNVRLIRPPTLPRIVTDLAKTA